MPSLADFAILAVVVISTQACASASVDAPEVAQGVMATAGFDEMVDENVRSRVRFYRKSTDGIDQNGVARGVWFAVRTTHRSDGQAVVEIADERCAGLSAVLYDLAEIDLGGLDLPGISPPNLGLEPGRDGRTYRIWGLRRENGVRSEVSATAMSGQIGDFGRFSEEQLSSCWAPYRE